MGISSCPFRASCQHFASTYPDVRINITTTTVFFRLDNHLHTHILRNNNCHPSSSHCCPTNFISTNISLWSFRLWRILLDPVRLCLKVITHFLFLMTSFVPPLIVKSPPPLRFMNLSFPYPFSRLYLFPSVSNKLVICVRFSLIFIRHQKAPIPLGILRPHAPGLVRSLPTQALPILMLIPGLLLGYRNTTRSHTTARIIQ